MDAPEQGPSTSGLMADKLKWSWCTDKRNKVHNKSNELQSFQNYHSQPPSEEKLLSTELVPGAKKAGDCCPREHHARQSPKEHGGLSTTPSLDTPAKLSVALAAQSSPGLQDAPASTYL